ncbi:MlaD family protein [Paracoccus benzoatiresistens]|uniref:MlaD family protein n=1 Tax=Paracoccus benzoatiresistens TaxID=2997341 RepID=A0ABT4J9C7_9RHOB|nr:MlaD family protein [Paracoccus sp. EF6]MCZ0963738.1 MlaD family protein [Paracoccus sp. EF6]
METKANYTLIGAFTVFGFLGILVFLLWFAQVELNRKFAYYDVYFADVSGLVLSSDVLFAGLPVGRVAEMELAPDNPMPVRVRLEVREDTPIRSDSVAELEVQGVTGVVLVAVSAGSRDAALLARPGSSEVPVIASGRSALQTLSDEGPQIIDRLSLLAEELSELLGKENQARVSAILANVERSSGHLDQALDDVAAAAETFGSLGGQVDGLGQDATAAFQRLSDAASRAETLFGTATSTLQRIDGLVADDLSPAVRQVERSASSLAALSDRGKATLDNLDLALASGTRAFDAAETVIGSDIAGAAGDLRATLTAVNDALASLPDDLPQISANLREASGNAASAFRSLDDVLDGVNAPVRSFARDTLPQVSRLAQDMRALVGNANQLISALRRNPAQLLSEPRVPEFRR